MRSFRDGIRQKDFVVTAELPVKLETTVADMHESIAQLRALVDAVQVTDDRGALGRMSSLAAASIALQLGVDAVVHLSCRDRNRIALQADLLGAAAMGVTSLMLLRGAKFEDKQAKGVFEIDAESLTGLARVIGEETKLVAPPGFLLGGQATVFAPDEQWRASGIRNKIESGTRFFQSQPCLNIELVADYVSKLIGLKVLHQVSMLITVPLLCSVREARLFKELHPGAAIGEQTYQRLSQADDAVDEGVRICAETIVGVREIAGIAGVNILYEGSSTNVVAALRAAGVAVQGGE